MMVDVHNLSHVLAFALYVLHLPIIGDWRTREKVPRAQTGGADRYYPRA